MNGQSGKGDKRRPMNEKKFRKHFDEINWKQICPNRNCKKKYFKTVIDRKSN